jgi:hypothetical protein
MDSTYNVKKVEPRKDTSFASEVEEEENTKMIT